MSFVKYLGDNRFEHRVVFQRNSHMRCVYCGRMADTREHAPSKVFLEKPLPDDLPTVPACKKCNNSFSADELYVATLIGLLVMYYTGKGPVPDETISNRIMKCASAKEAYEDYFGYLAAKELKYAERIIRILKKLAVCHATYELTDGFFVEDHEYGLDVICWMRNNMTKEHIDDFSYAIPVGRLLVPEIGSRVFDKIYAAEAKLMDQDGNVKKVRTVLLDWSEIQEDGYRYICYSDDEGMFVKIVIKEFLFAEIRFNDIGADQ